VKRRARAALWRSAAAAALLPAACGAPPRPAEPPNVLLIVVDTLRRDHLGAYGYRRATSPNLDGLAAESLRYERALSQAPWTLPAVAALLTARDPSALGITSTRSVVPPDLVLLPEILQAHGYVTGAVVSHKFVSARWGFDQGFDSFDESNVRGHRAVTSPGVSDAALAFLDAHADERFFLFVHYFDPHFSYLEHEGFGFAGEAPYTGPVRSGASFEQLSRLRLSPADGLELRRIYDSEIAFTDHHIGRLLDALRARGLLEKTLVVLTSDHGEEFLERGGIGHGKTLHEELVGVPLLVRRPGGRPGVVRRPVALLDVFPSVLDAAGIPQPRESEGVVLPDDGGAEAGRILFSATQQGRGLRAAVDPRHKLVRRSDGRMQLFDLERDPGETRDLSAQVGRLAPALERALGAYESRILAAQAGARLELSRSEREALRSLGYAEEEK
jgi:arylsulfatase A-like enzyme